jgi:hypothetical protein
MHDGKSSCHDCKGKAASTTGSEDLVSEIARKVIEQLGLK